MEEETGNDNSHEEELEDDDEYNKDGEKNMRNKEELEEEKWNIVDEEVIKEEELEVETGNDNSHEEASYYHKAQLERFEYFILQQIRDTYDQKQICDAEDKIIYALLKRIRSGDNKEASEEKQYNKEKTSEEKTLPSSMKDKEEALEV